MLYHVGYIGFYLLSLRQIENKWKATSEYSEDLKKISIPVTLPYMPDQNEYVAIDGSISIDGSIYRKVMHKYSQDTVHLILASDRLSENLNQSFNDWINSMTGTETNQSNKSSLIKSLIKEYFPETTPLALSLGFRYLDQKYFFYITKHYSLSLDIDTPPPQV